LRHLECHHSHLRVCVAHPDTDDGRADLRHTPENEQTRFYHYTESLFKRVLPPTPQPPLVFASKYRAADRGSHARAHHVSLYRDPKGFFPTQDTGIIQGHSQAPEIHFLRRHVAEATATGHEI